MQQFCKCSKNRPFLRFVPIPFGIDFVLTYIPASLPDRPLCASLYNDVASHSFHQNRKIKSMDAITLLKNDHDKVKAIFKEFEPLTERAVKTRTELFARLYEELETHTHIEEKIFYPVLRKEAETHDIVLEGVEEHHVIKVLLRELKSEDVGTEKWGSKLHVLSENVDHHVEEEEEKMFPSCREVLEKAKIVDLGDKMEAEKKIYKAANF